MNDRVRQDVENTIKGFSLDRNRIFEVSKQKYSGILKTIECTFVYHNGTIHWANMGKFKPELPSWTIDCRNNALWFEKINEMIPDPDGAVYVLLEGSGQRPKYWVYEMYLDELKVILNEIGLKDYYIVSKKYDWLISENHHDIVSFVGKGLEETVNDYLQDGKRERRDTDIV